MLDERARAEAVSRLREIAQKTTLSVHMLEGRHYCIEVLNQIQSVQAALQAVSESILEAHLHACVVTAVQDRDRAERERMLEKMVGVFRHRRR